MPFENFATYREIKSQTEARAQAMDVASASVLMVAISRIT